MQKEIMAKPQSALDHKNIDGKAVALKVQQDIKQEVEELLKNNRRKPGLAVVLVGDNPASHVYVGKKVESCQKVGFNSFKYEFPAELTTEELIACIEKLNQDKAVDGILVQLPLPKHISTEHVLNAIDPEKDVDGLHPTNLGLLVSGKPGMRPCTPLGVMALLAHHNVELSGKKAVVIGRSNLVGKPISFMLLEKNATVTMCHSGTRDLDAVCRAADILVVAAGRPEFVTGSFVKEGAVVIDVGINRIELPSGKGKLVGDVHFAEAREKASLITPVPGGVGPMTVAMLLANTLTAYKRREG
jgi:methylenetetrahydrofolate dehydrogenase (NADP+)/methenyltetrahydrofolate cyclohydrolase